MGRSASYLFACCASAAALGTSAPRAMAVGTIQLNPAQHYQTITGWEAVAQAGQEDAPGFNNYKNQLFNLAINDLGINRMRLEVRSGAEAPVDYWSQYRAGQIDLNTFKATWYTPVNDNANSNSINANGFQFAQLDFKIDNVINPMRQIMGPQGRQLYVNLCYVSFNKADENLFGHKDPQEYAEFVEATYLHMQSKYGFVPDAWEVVLEPENTSFWWNGTRLGNAIVAAGNRLKADGFNPKFIAPSVTDMSHAPSYFDQIIAVPGAKQYLSEIAYHRYGGVSDANIQAIAQRGTQNGINTSMLEHIGSDYKDLHKDLKLGNVSAWEQYTLAYPTSDNGAQYYTIGGTADNPTINMGSRTKFLRQYFHYIHEGAVRIDASTGNGNFDPVTFINPDGGYVSVVMALAGGSFSIDGLPAGKYGVGYTTDAAYDVQLPQITLTSGQTLNTSIPTAGVLTIYAVPEPASAAVLLLVGLTWLGRRRHS